VASPGELWGAGQEHPQMGLGQLEGHLMECGQK
jgi:hypothetical protein